MSSVFLISDAAKRVQVEAHVLRYWEDELGLPIKRNELGHRYYTEDDIKRFQDIKDLKERGLQLKAIKMVLKNGKLDVIGVHTREEGLAAETAQMETSQKEAFLTEAEAPEASQTETPQKEAFPTDTEAAEMVQTEAGQEETGSEENALIHPAQQLVEESREEKAARLQWLLKQLFRETLQENNRQLCDEVKESLLKELDYQFRAQEEREEEREQKRVRRDEEHFKRLDELLRKKRNLLKK